MSDPVPPAPVPPPPGFDGPPAPPPSAFPPPASGPVGRGAPPPGPRGPSKLLFLLGLAGIGVGGYALQYALGRSYLDEEALLHGSIIGGFGLLFFCLWLRRAVNGVVASAVFVMGVAAVAVAANSALEEEALREAESLVREQFFAAISPVCAYGAGVPEATGYVAGTTNSAVFFMQPSSGDLYPSRYGVTDEHRPGSVGDVNLVICSETEARVIETCPYSTSAGERILTREQYIRTVNVVDAVTAEVLDTRVMEGSMPAECPASRTFSEYEYSAKNTGSLPSDRDAIALISSWLSGTGTRAATPASSGVKPGDEPSQTGKP